MTKLNPGKFDCYAHALPDEPMFTLLARDPLAPTTVQTWALLRELTRGESPKAREALDVAIAMENWRAVRLASMTPAPTMAEIFLRGANASATDYGPGAVTRCHPEVRAYTYAEVLELMETFAIHRLRLEHKQSPLEVKP